MPARFAKVSEIAERFRVSADAVYLWIRQGKIPADCVIRIAGTVRVDEETFERQLRSGALYQPRGRKPARGEYECSAQIPLAAEDDVTTAGRGPRIRHKWIGETGSVHADHPFSPEMTGKTR
jgi:hypothetical protein